MAVHERELHRVLAKHPELIEPGLKYVDSEIPIGRGLYCDILFTDSSNKRVYVEVKWTAGRRAVIQVEQYELMSMEDRKHARFVLVALEAKPGIPELVARRGFEYIQIDRTKLKEIVPEWHFPPCSSKGTAGARVSRQWSAQGQEARLLGAILDNLQDELPSIQFDNKGPRLVLDWEGPDKFIIDFSSRVADGIRCSFVVDLDAPDSERRSEFQARLLRSASIVEDMLGTIITNNTKEEDLVAGGYLQWAKVSRHRRMGVYCFYRSPGLDMNDEHAVAEAFAPNILQFIDRVDSLLHRFRPLP